MLKELFFDLTCAYTVIRGIYQTKNCGAPTKSSRDSLLLYIVYIFQPKRVTG